MRSLRTRPASCSVLVLALMAFAASCAREPEIVTRRVTMHVPAACETGPRPYALYYPSGDFQPAADAPLVEAQFLSGEGGSLSHIPQATRALLVDVSVDGTPLRWRGIGSVETAGDVDVLLWPAAAPCALSPPSTPLPARTDAALGAIDARHILVSGGLGRGKGALPGSFVVDLATGVITPVTSDLLAPRMQASVTPFSSGKEVGDRGALVAGGIRPDTGALLASAEVFAQKTGEFDGMPILLAEGRHDHAAVPIVTGETLLVGGSGDKGPLGSLELVDPKTRRARAGLATLDVPRTHPHALRLASGEIFVAGGFDAAGTPVGMLEWLSPDAWTHSRPSRKFLATKERGFVALPGGGALAVIAPDPPSPNFANVWVISASGELEAATPITGQLSLVRLFAGNQGAPLLWTGARWLRWQPWRGEFGAAEDVAPTATGPASPDVLSAPDGGLALWLLFDDIGTRVVGLRFDARSQYACDSARAPLLANDTNFFAPDRLVVPGTSASLVFDPTRGLVLAPGASAFLADATFAAFTLEVAVSGGAAPLIVLRDDAGVEIEIGGPACPLALDHPTKVRVARDREILTVTEDAGTARRCLATPKADARLTVGLRGGVAESVVRGLTVERRGNASSFP